VKSWIRRGLVARKNGAQPLDFTLQRDKAFGGRAMVALSVGLYTAVCTRHVAPIAQRERHGSGTVVLGESEPHRLFLGRTF
jgi:hypothetical protein